MADPGGRLFTTAFVALSLSDLAYFLASGLMIGVTPFFVTGHWVRALRDWEWLWALSVSAR